MNEIECGSSFGHVGASTATKDAADGEAFADDEALRVQDLVDLEELDDFHFDLIQIHEIEERD